MARGTSRLRQPSSSGKAAILQQELEAGQQFRPLVAGEVILGAEDERLLAACLSAAAHVLAQGILAVGDTFALAGDGTNDMIAALYSTSFRCHIAQLRALHFYSRLCHGYLNA